MKKVLVTKPIHEKSMLYLKDNFEVIVAEDESKETIMELVKDVDAIVLRLAEIDKDIIDNARSLKIIAKHGAGIDNIDLEHANLRNIQIVNTGNANSLTVAEHAVATMLSLFKRIPLIDKEVRNGNWYIKNDNKSLNYSNKTLGLIGIGEIGSNVARICKNGFNMRVMAYDPYIKKKDAEKQGIELFDQIDKIFEQADIISVHTPLTEETENLIDKRLLDKLHSKAIVLNFARGGIIKEDDLYKKLKNNEIMGAGMDAFVIEPIEADSKFKELDNVILSPHAASFTDDCRETMGNYLVDDLIKFFNGENPTRKVNKLNLS